ncbi:MAG: hypothetical protein K0Q66_671 [Chitinophagaceae bacterium]|jgi:predicted PurR-regulated permease PerM|nr:hypothetical protein [Chitinophagaceae bacterium]
MQQSLLSKAVRVLVLLTLAVVALYYARSFLIPLTFAGLIAMLLLPVSKWLQGKGVSQGIAGVLCIVLLIGVFAALISLLAWQLTDFIGNIQQLEQMMNKAVSQIQQMISETFTISPKQQKEIVEQQSQGGSGGLAKTVFGTVTGVFVDLILILVYTFLFLYFRNHIKAFILKIVPTGQKANTQKVMTEAGKVGQQYITGLGSMIVLLWVMYGIGFSIVGVKNAIFFAILCGILEIIPFVGNITGTAITVLMTIAQGGDTGMVVGVIATYALVQFIQTYILEPLVVGSEVNINPLFTIMAIVLGELLWGIPGMILAIPLLGILKIVFDHVEPLKPYGFLIGEGKKKRSGLIDKLKLKLKG